MFQHPPLKYLCNVNVLTTGFDAPNVDCVVLLRPTLSAGLYYQMVGRGFRLHPGKANCLVLDYGGNVLRHGPVDQLQVIEKRGDGTGEAPAKECPSCRALIAPAYSNCPQCGHAFPPPERKKHESQATKAGVLSGQVTDCEYEVRDIAYSVHTKKDADESAPKTLRVDYRLGLDYWVSEWICIEHTGWARAKPSNGGKPARLIRSRILHKKRLIWPTSERWLTPSSSPCGPWQVRSSSGFTAANSDRSRNPACCTPRLTWTMCRSDRNAANLA